ncbi:carboxypeptidase-like regulatory domain-containing protein, partial [Hydrotalea sp.]
MKQIVLNLFRLLLLITVSLFTASSVHAQSIVLKGRVVDAVTQTPIEGVSIAVKKTNRGTTTHANGDFSISVEKNDVLEFSYVGFESKRLVVHNADAVAIALNPQNADLSAVVVTATGIKKEAKRLGYAVQTIDATKLTKAREADPINALKGNAAGLAININSEIGHSPGIIVRGENGANSQPMYVVDGVPFTSDTYNINPDDIETITILKGPNAASLYGFQGKNGAIIITTKKGSKSKGIHVDFNSSTQINKGFIALPKYQDLYGPGDNGKYAFGGGGSGPANYRGGGAIGVGVNDYDYDVWGPQFRGQLLPQYDGKYDPTQNYTTTFADGSTYIGHVQPTPWLARGKDNLRKFIQAGLLSTNSVSISSSTEKTDVRFSFGNTYQKGIVPNTQLNNFNVTASVTQRFNPKLTLSSYLNYSRQSTPNIPDVQYGPNS